MSFQNVDMESAMRRLADRRIEEAMREGKFDNLPGTGKPLDLEPMPANENARLTWWALRLMKQNDFTPEEVRWRKQIDDLKGELSVATTQRRVVALVAQINRLVQQLNTLGTNALSSPNVSVSVEVELRRLNERLAAAAPAEASAAAAPGTTLPSHEAAPFAKIYRPAQPASNPSRGASVLPDPVPAAESHPVAAIRHCGNAACKSRNSASARFCRRCGSLLPTAATEL